MRYRTCLRTLIVALAVFGPMSALAETASQSGAEDTGAKAVTSQAGSQTAVAELGAAAEAIEADVGEEAADTGSAPVNAESQAPDANTYGLTIRRNDRDLEIAGNVPGEAARQALLAAASAAFPDLPLTISLLDEPDPPAGFVAAALRAIKQLHLFAEGEVELARQEVSFSGSVYHAKAKAEFDEAIATGWPAGYSVRAGTIGTGPSGDEIAAADCQAALTELTSAQPIAFEAGRADIRGDSRPVVDRVAYTALRCPDTLIAVAGHTDSDGTDEANYRLSLDRARTVIDLLVEDGLVRERFTALGYGESRPLASNGTLAGKARNRRIEFVLRD